MSNVKKVKNVIRDFEKANHVIKKFRESLERLKSKQFSLDNELTEEQKWEEHIKLVEQLEEYAYLMENEQPPVDESKTEIYVESQEPKTDNVDFNESVINKLADRIVKTMRSTAVRGKTEDLDGGIGVDDIGLNSAGLVSPLGGGGNAPLVEPNEKEPEAPKTVSADGMEHLKQSIEVLKGLGLHGKAGELGGLVSSLQVL